MHVRVQKKKKARFSSVLRLNRMVVSERAESEGARLVGVTSTSRGFSLYRIAVTLLATQQWLRPEPRT